MESRLKTARAGVRGELRPMVTVAAPLVIAEVGWMAMGVVDTMMVGRVGADAIAAVGLGTMLFYAAGVFASGFLLGLDTLVAQAYGAQDREDCRRSLVNGMWIVAGVVFLVVGVGGGFCSLLVAFS